MTTVPSCAEIGRDVQAGNSAAAFDKAGLRLTAGHEDAQTAYLYVQSLARIGSTQQALALYQSLGLDASDVLDHRALRARLEKDVALATTGQARRGALRHAADRYAQIWRDTGSSYPGINAASLMALAGEGARATDYARQILADPLPENADYYDRATRWCCSGKRTRRDARFKVP